MESEWLCGDCDYGFDLFGDFCCKKHNSEECPYPCEECADFKEIEWDKYWEAYDEKRDI